MSPATARRSYPLLKEELWRRAMQNPDFKQYINLYNILTPERSAHLHHVIS